MAGRRLESLQAKDAVHEPAVCLINMFTNEISELKLLIFIFVESFAQVSKGGTMGSGPLLLDLSLSLLTLLHVEEEESCDLELASDIEEFFLIFFLEPDEFFKRDRVLVKQGVQETTTEPQGKIRQVSVEVLEFFNSFDTDSLPLRVGENVSSNPLIHELLEVFANCLGVHVDKLTDQG